MYEEFLSKYGTNTISLKIDDGSHGIPEEAIFYHALAANGNSVSPYWRKHPALANEKLFTTINNPRALYWYENTLGFLRIIASEITIRDATFSFINYGSTELVFLLQEKYQPDRTVIISQPYLSSGVVEQEFHHLQRFYSLHPHDIIRPIDYINDPFCRREAYITPYIAYAGCVSTLGDNWGEWTTLPDFRYHFSHFTRAEYQAILTAIIAKLVYLYDEDLNLGIADIHLRSGDFILDPLARVHFSYNTRKALQCLIPNPAPKPPSLSSDDLARYFFNHLTLTTIRSTLKIPFSGYIKRIKSEFTCPTSPDSIINTRSHCPTPHNLVNAGIALGLSLRGTN